MTEAFLAARLEHAATRQVSLALNLTDSVLTMAIEGVPVRQIPLNPLRINGAVEAARRQGRLSASLGGSFTLAWADASIPRAPITVVQAPRDTAEARMRPAQEIPVEKGETHFVLHFDRGLVLSVRQPSSGLGWIERTWLGTRDRVWTASQAAGEVLRGRAPEHKWRIHLQLSPDDARALYRALPDSARLAVRL